jgi:hypothetical protein
MKSARLATFILIVISTSIFTRCTREPLDYISTTKEFISQGNWKVDYYYAGQDKTAQYTGHQFIFNADGTIYGTDGNNTFNGSWNTITDVNRNDVLQIHINASDPRLMELNEHWTVRETGAVVISMKEGAIELRFKKL